MIITPGVPFKLDVQERTYWYRWPEWLCHWLTNHALIKKWGRYDLDIKGRSCRCGLWMVYD